MSKIEKPDSPIEYAASGRSTCKKCHCTIAEGSLRVGLMTKSFHHDGFDARWYHWSCVKKTNKMIGNSSRSEALVGFERLRFADQQKVRAAFGEEDPSNSSQLEQDDEEYVAWKKELFSSVKISNNVFKSLLTANGYNLENYPKIVDIVQIGLDLLKNGVPSECPKCNMRSLTYFPSCGLWKCRHGWVDEYTRCHWKQNIGCADFIPIQRNNLVIPDDMLKVKYFKNEFVPPQCSPSPSPSPSAPAPATASPDAMEIDPNPKTSKEYSALARKMKGKEMEGLTFLLVGPPTGFVDKDDIISKIQSRNGIILDKWPSVGKKGKGKKRKREEVEFPDDDVDESKKQINKPTFVITTQKEVDKKKKPTLLNRAIQEGIAVVNEDFVDAMIKGGVKAQKLRECSRKELEKFLLVEWKPTVAEITEPSEVVKPAITSPGKKIKAETPSTPAKRVKYSKDSQIYRVDDDFLSDNPRLKIFEDDDGNIYHSIMNLTDLESGANSFYVLQLCTTGLWSDPWAVCFRWGRIGTEYRQRYQIHEFEDLEAALREFHEKFEKMTGTAFADRFAFKKKPGRYHLVQFAAEGEESDQVEVQVGKKSKKVGMKSEPRESLVVAESSLHRSVQDLVEMIFDATNMQNAMRELNIDTKKMPLGKISIQAVKDGFNVLSEINHLLVDRKLKGTEELKRRCIGLSSRFYTVVPHDFGDTMPPVIDSLTHLRQRIKTMETLYDIEVASRLMKQVSETKSTKTEIPEVDQKYATLNANIVPLDRKCGVFEIIEKYVQNTHGKTHSEYELEIDEIFEIKRNGEEEKYAKSGYEKVSNKQLLWHGSGLANWVGILSQGLRIAPPEAPMSGYMFGKGVYFADSVSKSANYCRVLSDKPTGLMLLGEVALGNMCELHSAKYVKPDELKKEGFLSTFGHGKTGPDRKDSLFIGDGKIEVPVGKMKEDSEMKSSLLYNEFIVYDVDQIKMRYLVTMKFKFKKDRYW